MSIELRHLRYFVAVAEELHFGRASARAHVSQPSLSQQIRKLEDAIGVELFHRTKRSVELSAAGRAMLEPARRAISEADEAVDTARRAARGETGHLRIGFIETAASTIVPRAVRRFSSDQPDVRLTLRELGVGIQLDGLRSQVLDVALVRPPFDEAGLGLELVADEGLVVVVPERHRFAERKVVDARSLAKEPLILLSREVVPGLHDQVIALQQAHGNAALIAQEATSIQAVLGLVAAELGISLLPASARSLDRAGVVFVGLRSSPRTSIVAAWRHGDRSPLVHAFVAAARAAAPPPG